MTALSEFYFNSGVNVAQYDLIQIDHPDFSTSAGDADDPRPSGVRPYRLVRNNTRGLAAVTHEGPAGPFEYRYLPARIQPIGSDNSLDQTLAVSLGDLGDVIDKEIENITIVNTMIIRPTVEFRTYRSDDLSAPMFGPLTMEISDVTVTKDGTTFVAHPPRINNSRTGELYDLDRFPMLRGFL